MLLRTSRQGWDPTCASLWIEQETFEFSADALFHSVTFAEFSKVVGWIPSKTFLQGLYLRFQK